MVRSLKDGREVFASGNSLEDEFMDIIYYFAKFREKYPNDTNPFILRLHSPHMQFQIMETIINYCAKYCEDLPMDKILTVEISHMISISALHSILKHMNNVDLYGFSSSYIHSYYSNDMKLRGASLYIRMANSAILHGIALITKQACEIEDMPKEKSIRRELMKFGEIVIPCDNIKELFMIMKKEINDFQGEQII